MDKSASKIDIIYCFAGHARVRPSVHSTLIVRNPKMQFSDINFGICLLKTIFCETFATIRIKINRKLSRQQRKQK